MRDPFPPAMLYDRAGHVELIATLRSRLTWADAYLCELIEESPTVLKICRPRLEDGRPDGAADARIYEFFPALRMRDFICLE